MIAHHDELHMVPPSGDAPTLAAVHIRRDVLEQRAASLTRGGWSSPEIIACRACAAPVPLTA